MRVRELQCIQLVEAASPELVGRARDLFREYQQAIGIDLCFQSFEKELAELPGQYTSPRGHLLLAMVENTLAGCAAMRPLGATTCEMKRLYVRSAFRGQGIGERLARQIIALARQAGYRQMRLDTHDSMEAAIGLYRKLGFVECEPYGNTPCPGILYFKLLLE
jgi:putative acetyltransferase